MTTNLLNKKLNLNIPYAICISLREEEQRRKQTIQECNKIGLPIKFFLTDPHPKGGVEGCKDSHKQVIQHAKDNNLEYILVLEDDVLFDEQVIKQKKPLQVPKNFDMFYLGYHINRGSRIGNQLLHIQSSLTTHAYIMHNRVYDLFLNTLDTEEAWNIPQFQDLNQFERPFFTQKPPIRAIDMFYAKNIHHARNQTFGVYPMIAYQRPEYSRIENANVDYRQLFVNKARYFANQVQSVCRGQYKDKGNQQSMVDFLKTQDDAYDYDYFHVYKKNPIIFTKEIQNTDWDVLYITDEQYLIRKQVIHHKPDTWRTKYLYSRDGSLGCSLVANKNGKWLPDKPILCLYGTKEENSSLEKLSPHYYLFYCSEQYKTIDDNKIPKHHYNVIPNHQVLLKNDITFFIDHLVTKPNIILWMTKDTFDYEWKCDWWQEQGTYTVPFEGKALFTNMSRYILTILFDTQEICDKFCEKYEVVFNPKNMMVLGTENSKGKHEFEVEETTPIPWKIVAKTTGQDFMKYLNTYRMLKRQFPKFTMDLYGCSKSNKKRFRNMNLQGVKALKGDIQWQKGDIYLMLSNREDLYWKAKMATCFVLSDQQYGYMENGNDIILGETLPKMNREELKRNSFDVALKQKVEQEDDKLTRFFIRT